VASPAYNLRGANIAAQRTASDQAARLVTGISATTRAAIRSLVVRAFREKLTVQELTDLIRETIGLTEVQAHALMTYKRSLQEAGTSKQRVKLLVERDRARKLRQRASTIARFEVMDALNSAQLRRWQSERADGTVSKRATKEVITTGDVKLCDTCASTIGKKYQLDSTIIRGRKNPPFHPRCRCAIALNP
jgi:SPP1 gp7 family putative phage head morphogenesis protein